jgi:hypothetical protein
MFALVVNTQAEYDGLVKMSDSQDVVDYVKGATVVDFAVGDVTGFEKIIVLKQNDKNGNINLYFACDLVFDI